jgi:hypothetical protein
LTQRSEWPQLRQRLLALKKKGLTAQRSADQLNREGQTSPHHKPFTTATIRAALTRCGLTNVRRATSKDQLALREDEGFVPDLAREIGVRRQGTYAWIRTGKLPARQMDGPQGRWIVHADAALLEHLKAASDAAPGSERV